MQRPCSFPTRISDWCVENVFTELINPFTGPAHCWLSFVAWRALRAHPSRSKDLATHTSRCLCRTAALVNKTCILLTDSSFNRPYSEMISTPYLNASRFLCSFYSFLRVLCSVDKYLCYNICNLNIDNIYCYYLLHPNIPLIVRYSLYT